MPRRDDVIVFDRVSDITPEEWLLSDSELLVTCWSRYVHTGKQEQRLHAWLNDHGVYPKKAPLADRVRALSREGLISLLQEIEDWRVEANPPGADGEFE